MKTQGKILLIIAVMIMGVMLGFIIKERGSGLFTGIEFFLFFLILVFAFIASFFALRRDREEKEGIPREDEMTTLLKYKAGYYAYLYSMYMWLFIFLLRDKFPDIETRLGGGILLSALIGFFVKIIVKRNFNEK